MKWKLPLFIISSVFLLNKANEYFGIVDWLQYVNHTGRLTNILVSDFDGEYGSPLDLVEEVSFQRNASRPARLPNVILIVIDSLRADYAPPIYNEAMPFVASQIEEGNATVFSNAYAPASWTLPSTRSILTGLFPYRHKAGNQGIFCRDINECRHGTKRENLTLPQQLGLLRGYATGMFTQNYVTMNANASFFEVAKYYQEKKSVGADMLPDIDDFIVTATEKNTPFFIYIHNDDVHAPRKIDGYDSRFGGLEEIISRTGISDFSSFGGERYAFSWKRDAAFPDMLKGLLITYRWSTTRADDMINGLSSFLSSKEIDDETIIIITADHGEEFYEHQRLEEETYFHLGGDQHAGYGVYHGHTLFDEQIRVPLIIIGGRELRERESSELRTNPVSLVDLAPTIYSLVGINAKGLDGYDILTKTGSSALKDRILLAEGSTYTVFPRVAIIDTDETMYFSPFEPNMQRLERFHGRSWINPNYERPNQNGHLIQSDGIIYRAHESDIDKFLLVLCREYSFHPMCTVMKTALAK